MEKDLIDGILNKQIILEIPISLFTDARTGRPQLQMRKICTDLDLLQAVLYCASRGQTLLCKPTFKDELKALNQMKEKGLVSKQENGELSFNFF